MKILSLLQDVADRRNVYFKDSITNNGVISDDSLNNILLNNHYRPDKKDGKVWNKSYRPIESFTN